jgi:hypothetical protein
MKKIKIKKFDNFLQCFLNELHSVLVHPDHRWPSLFLHSETGVSYHVVFEKINMEKWNLPESAVTNDANLKRVIYLNGWINQETREEGAEYSKTVPRNCMVYFYGDDKIYLLKKKKK